MINRILIRIKVVQMLYSYLLTRNDFKIPARPNPAVVSNDKRFAYDAYIDLLMLMFEVSGHPSAQDKKQSFPVEKKLASSKVISALLANPEIKAIIFKQQSDIDSLRHVVEHLNLAIESSTVFTDFKRRRSADFDSEIHMWQSLLLTVFARDPKLDEAMRQLPGYSKIGFDLAIQMAVDTLQSYFDSVAGYQNAINDLKYSLDEAYKLYISIFALMIELTNEQRRRIENAKTKHLATADELNPNMRFVNNAFIAKLTQSSRLEALIHDLNINWEPDIALISSLLNSITSSQLYADYMAAENNDYAADCDFWRSALRNIVFASDDMLEALEDKSIFWNDDLQIMGTFVIKTIKISQADPESPVSILPKYKDDEDAAFGARLFADTVAHRDEYREYIDRFVNTGSWDPERLALMDIVIIITAIDELLNYPNIPVAVTMNEYVEIAGAYSSPKSGQFVNGILFNIADSLRKEGRLLK